MDFRRLLFLSIVNIVAGFFYMRIDFTAEKRYTLSNISKEILYHIPEGVKVEVYLEGNLPSGFKHLRKETADMLSDLRPISEGHLQVSFIDRKSVVEGQRVAVRVERGGDR